MADNLLAGWPKRIAETSQFAQAGTEEKLSIATAILIVESGRPKTQQIAELAGLSESTIFRATNKESLVENSIEWAWRFINEAISEANFESPVMDATVDEVIRNDLDALLSLFDEDLGRLAVTLAFTQMRRPGVFHAKPVGAAHARFMGRLSSLCKHLVADKAEAYLLATYETNVCIALWFTWLSESDRRKDADYLMGKDRVLGSIQAHLKSATAEKGSLAGNY